MFNPATEQIMKKRIFYIISFLVIFCIEVLIALYVRDRFIRPYVGDMLVVVLVYSFVRIFLPTGIPRMPFYVFLFACFVEVLQYFQLVETLGVHEPRSPNCAGFYVRLGRYCLLCCGMRFHCLIRAFRPA